MGKFLISGLAAGVAMFLVMMLVGMVAPTAEYQNTAIFRPWNDPLMYYMFVHPFLMGVLLSFVWSKASVLIREENQFKKGLKFGLYIWAIFGIPGMLMSLSSFQISVLLVASWTASVLLQDLVAGIVFAYLSSR